MNIYLFLVATLLCTPFSYAGQLERKLILAVENQDRKQIEDLLRQGANPSVALIECQFLDKNHLISSLENIGGSWAEARKESQRKVVVQDEIPQIIFSTAKRFHEGNQHFLQIDGILDNVKTPLPSVNGINFVVGKPPQHPKYLVWLQGNGSREDWLQIATYLKNGWGVLGLKEDLLNTDLGDIVLFHPSVPHSAKKLFEQIQIRKALGKISRGKFEYFIGLLLGYYEPNVYVWCFGTKMAQKAYPDIDFNPEEESDFRYLSPVDILDELTEGLQDIPFHEQELVLHRRFPEPVHAMQKSSCCDNFNAKKLLTKEALFYAAAGVACYTTVGTLLWKLYQAS